MCCDRGDKETTKQLLQHLPQLDHARQRAARSQQQRVSWGLLLPPRFRVCRSLAAFVICVCGGLKGSEARFFTWGQRWKTRWRVCDPLSVTRRGRWCSGWRLAGSCPSCRVGRTLEPLFQDLCPRVSAGEPEWTMDVCLPCSVGILL